MDPRVKIIPLSHDFLQSDIGIVWLKEHYVPKRAQFFIETVKEVYSVDSEH